MLVLPKGQSSEFKLILVLKTERHRYPDKSVLGHGHLRKVPQGGAALRCLTYDHLIKKQIYMDKINILWADDEIELLKEYYKTHTIEQTSKKFEVSISTVKKYSNKKFINRTEDDRKKANYNHVKTFRKRTKEKAVEYKGGKCNICNYDRCVSALEFHHLEPSKKDFTLSQSMNTAWNKIEEELDKCILVCANCHREIHEGIIKIVS
jgi:hypothetical protein